MSILRLSQLLRLAFLVVLAGLIGPGLAAADTKVRIEYVRLLKGGDDKTPASQVLWLVVAPAVTVSSTGSSVQSAAAPTFPPDRNISGGVYARVTALQGAAAVVVGDAPTATDLAGVRIAVGQDPIYLPISPGQKVAVIEAADAPSTLRIDGSAATQPVSAASLPLPTGAATDTKLEAVRALLAAPLTVSGAGASGSAVSGNPVLMAGSDGTNARTLATDSAGILKVAGTQTGNAVGVNGNAASGAADAGSPVKIGGVYNATQPTVTTGQRVDWQMTNRGEGLVSLAPSENHVGEVGGNQATVTVPLTVTSGSAYAAGNAVDGLKTIAGAARVAGGSGMVQSISLAFKSAQTAGADVYIFASSPTGTTVTDKTAFSLASADADKPIGISHVTDCKTAGTTTFCQSQREAMPYALSAGTSLYAVVVTTGTPTFQSTSDAILTVRILRN